MQDTEQSKLAKLDKVLYKWFTAMHKLKRLNLFTNEMTRTNWCTFSQGIKHYL